MKRALIICLAIVTLLAVESSAEAGRRKDRKAAKKGGGGVYAGAYQRKSTSSYPVVAASHYKPVITAAPDLTIAEIATVGNVLTFTVKNIGQTASPETRLEVALGEPQTNHLEAQNVRVLPLQPNQSVRIRINSAPVENIHAQALVDPDHLVAEANEQNNDLNVTLAKKSIASEPPTLAEEHNWSQTGG